MIVVDSSALLAILLNEPRRDDCLAALANEHDACISAATLVECLIVAEGKGVGAEMASLIQQLGFEIVPVGEEAALDAWEAFRQWGKGRHPAGLNYGDCFSYAAAKQRGCPLLFIGEDFIRTDLVSAL